LRGPQHHFAWCDELAKWKHGDVAWDNLQMGMRRGTRPRLIVTTTPRPTALVRRVRALEGTVETIGRTADNVHSAEAFRDWAAETYGGTRLGRQELDGELFEEVEGALWTRNMIEKARHFGPLPRWKRIVVGVDPPVTAEGDACGIVVCALGENDIAYVVADCSVAGERPEGWARVVVQAAEAWGADRVVAEKNQGGEMVESVMRSIDAALPVRPVFAKGSKGARAEPVAALFDVGRAKLAGRFPELEDELAGLTYGGSDGGAGTAWHRRSAEGSQIHPRPTRSWVSRQALPGSLSLKTLRFASRATRVKARPATEDSVPSAAGAGGPVYATPGPFAPAPTFPRPGLPANRG
jgi:phage terminase large subunit-like protein